LVKRPQRRSSVVSVTRRRALFVKRRLIQARIDRADYDTAALESRVSR